MPVERVKDRIVEGGAEHAIARRTNEGWTIAAIEWQRELPPGSPETSERLTDPPYGYRVAPDGVHLEPDYDEMETLSLITAMIVRERRLPEIAAELNRRRLKTRSGDEWGPAQVFTLMPRIVEVSPEVFDDPAWPERRRRAV